MRLLIDQCKKVGLDFGPSNSMADQIWPILQALGILHPAEKKTGGHMISTKLSEEDLFRRLEGSFDCNDGFGYLYFNANGLESINRIGRLPWPIYHDETIAGKDITGFWDESQFWIMVRPKLMYFLEKLYESFSQPGEIAIGIHKATPESNPVLLILLANCVPSHYLQKFLA